MIPHRRIPIFILVTGLLIFSGCTTTIPEKNPVPNGSITQLPKIFGNTVIQGQSYTFAWSVNNPAIKEVRFWDFRNNSFIVTTVPVNSRGDFKYSLSADETRTLPIGDRFLILQYPDKDSDFSVIYDNKSGEIIRLHNGTKDVLARINQSRQYQVREIKNDLVEKLKNKVPEDTLFFALVEVSKDLSNDWIRIKSDNPQNFFRGGLITLNGTTTVYPGYLHSCICNAQDSTIFVFPCPGCCIQKELNTRMDTVDAKNGSYTFSLRMDSNAIEPGDYKALVWMQDGPLGISSNFSVTNSTYKLADDTDNESRGNIP
jgi:hypothetical protein